MMMKLSTLLKPVATLYSSHLVESEFMKIQEFSVHNNTAGMSKVSLIVR